MHRIFGTAFGAVYPMYVTKLERKGRTVAELDQAIEWLTGFDEATIKKHVADGTTFEDFFAQAHLNANVGLVTGVICGVRVEEIEDPLMQKIRYLDKLVDELYYGKAMEKVLRTPAPVATRAWRGRHPSPASECRQAARSAAAEV